MSKVVIFGTFLIFSLSIIKNTRARNVYNLELSSSQAKQIIGVRLTDLAKYTSSIPGLNFKHARNLEQSLNNYLPKQYKLKKVLNLFINDFPKISDKGILIPLTAFGTLEKNGELAFLQLETYFEDGLFSVVPVKTISLSETFFALKVSLANRKLIMKDSMNPSLQMIFPLGVGSFDEGILNPAITLLTPRFENAFIDKRAIISKRKKPRYFSGKPFIRITTSKNLEEGHTAIGFHVQPNLDTFVRAFDSHGCMRMQLNDLYVLHDIVKKGPHPRLPIDVKYYLEDSLEHPFPKINKPYKKVLNTGSKASPRWKLDRDGLVQTKKDWKSTAPIFELQDMTGDTYHALFDYDMSWRKAERMANLKKQCLEVNDYTRENLDRREKRKRERAYKKCVKSGVPRRSIRDRIYRWWVH